MSQDYGILDYDDTETIAAHRLPGPEIPGAEVDLLGWFRVPVGDGDHSLYEAARVEFFTGTALDTEETIAWLWPERVPIGMVTCLEGESETGKSLIVADMAARVTRGSPWPGANPGPHLAGQVLFCADEDGWESMIYPRLQAAGADVRRVGRLTDVDTHHPTEIEAVRAHSFRSLRFPEDLAKLEYNLRVRPEVRLVIVDPLSTFCQDKKSYVAALRQLNEIAARRGVAIVVTSRPPGRAPRNRLQLPCDKRAEAVRCVLHVLPDPEDDERGYLAPARMNFCAKPPWIPFRRGAQVAWEAPLEAPPEEATTSPAKERGAIRRAAEEWLREMLHDEDALASVVQKNAQECGISNATLRRAKADMKVRSYKKGQGQLGWWYWTLRPKEATPDETVTNGTGADLNGQDHDAAAEQHPEANGSKPGELPRPLSRLAEGSLSLRDMLAGAATARGGSDFDRFGRAMLREMLTRGEGGEGIGEEQVEENGMDDAGADDTGEELSTLGKTAGKCGSSVKPK